MAENNTNDPRGGEQVLLSVNLDTTGAVEQGAQLASGLNNALQGVGAGMGETSLKNYRQLIRDAQNEAQRLAVSVGLQDQAYVEAARRVAGLRDEFQEYTASVQSFNPDNQFQAIVQLGASMTGVIGAGVASMQLFGIETEGAQEAMAKLQQIMAISDGLNSIADLSSGWKNFKAVLGITTVAQVAQNTAVAQGAVVAGTQAAANTALAVTQTGVTTAVAGTSTAMGILSLAMDALGIGLVIGAISLLVHYWSQLTDVVIKFAPWLKTVGEFFGTITRAVTDFVGATSDASRALDSLTAATTRNNETLDNQIKLMSAMGTKDEEVHTLKIKRINNELEVLRQRLAVTGKLSEEEQKQFRDLKVAKQLEDINEANRITAKNRKEQEENKSKNDKILADNKAKQEKNKALLDKELEDIKNYQREAKKVIEDSTKNDREKELSELEEKYTKEIKSATKQGKSTTDLYKAWEIEKAIVTKKYADIVSDYLATKDFERLNTFDKQRARINKEIESLKKNATPEEVKNLNKYKNTQLYEVDEVEQATHKANDTDRNLSQAEHWNQEDDTDTPEQAHQKIMAITQAQLGAENASYDLKKILAQGHADELEEIEKDHSDNIINIAEENANAQMLLDQRVADAKIDNEQKIANMLGDGAALFAKNTVAYKALAIAQTTMDTYLSAQSAYKSMVGIPVVGPTLAPIAAGIAVLGGLKNVQGIMSVKVPGASGGSTGGLSGVNYQAPVINSTLLQQNANGSSALNNTLNARNNAPIKAYIVDTDLEKQKNKADLFSRLSSI
jgi:hypothetical protein